jgi:prepilin-type N-terminal cleavage/methylation domain-containing protein
MSRWRLWRAAVTDQRGFTMTEMLMVTTVLAVILGGVILVQQQGQQAYLFGSHRVEVQQNNRSALELMIRELRQAQSITATPSPTNLTFKTTQDGIVKTIQYQLSGTTLNRTVDGTTTPLIGGVNSLAMIYCSKWDPSKTTAQNISDPLACAATPGSVKLIVLQLETRTEDQVGTASPGNQRVALESLVRLRNVP